MFLKNWKTTLLGWAGGAAVVGAAVLTHHPIDAAVLAQAAMLAGIGTAAKDHDK